MTRPASPRITVAIPLHRSARWVDVVEANVRALDGLDAEIVVSDRTLHDDAATELHDRLAGDGRVRVVASRDGPDWVGHYNRLLAEARGTYFMWMPHDDDFGPGYVALLADALDDRPDAVLAFGDIDAVDVGGRPVARPRSWGPPPASAAGPSPPADEAVHLLREWNLGVCFRGVVRTDAVRRRGIRLRRLRGLARADILWVFEAALTGVLVHVPTARCRKRQYDTSTHAGWGIGWREEVGFYAAALAAVRRQTGMAGLRRWGPELAGLGWQRARATARATR